MSYKVVSGGVKFSLKSKVINYTLRRVKQKLHRIRSAFTNMTAAEAEYCVVREAPFQPSQVCHPSQMNQKAQSPRLLVERQPDIVAPRFGH
jgi:hypothetical protein